MIGPGNSGKSTMLKQIRKQTTHKSLIEEWDFDKKFRLLSSNWIHCTLLLSKTIDNICHQSIQMVDVYDQEWISKLQQWLVIYAYTDFHIYTPHFWDTETLPLLKTIWTQENAMHQILTVLSRHASYEMLSYLMNNQARLLQTSKNMIAQMSEEDCLRFRQKTTSIQEYVYHVPGWREGTSIRVIDVGGQRNERGKWLSLFDTATVVVFVASAADYHMMLEEDETQSAFLECKHLFHHVCRHESMADKPIILLMNKIDLLPEQIKKWPLHHVFKDATPDLSCDIKRSIYFLQSKLMKSTAVTKRLKPIYSYTSSAIESTTFQQIWKVVEATVLDENLEASGLPH